MKTEEETHETSQDYEKRISELKQKTIRIEIPPGPQCYCGNPRDFREPDFLCSVCYRWFHQKCIAFDVGPSLPFMTAYHFMCKKCNNSDEEVFSKKQANFAIMCQTALANLMCTHDGRVCFSEEREILPFLDKNWDVLTFQPRKANDSWHANIHKTLVCCHLILI
uniref:Set1/Ash2 histone methyltransferase complex subunit ASH2 n=1 Tax=Schistocephalus solidus TaxID=70667 RepID=A0A0X3QH86_SCHSO